MMIPGSLMALSPKMRTLAAQLLPKITPVVKEFPQDFISWDICLVLEKASGGSGFALLQIIDSIATRPGNQVIFPTPRVLDRINYSMPHWDYWGYWWSNGYRWNVNAVYNLLNPLIEALLAKNDAAGADRIFTEFMDYISSQEIQRRLVEIATKRNKPELARKWAATQPKQ